MPKIPKKRKRVNKKPVQSKPKKSYDNVPLPQLLQFMTSLLYSNVPDQNLQNNQAPVAPQSNIQKARQKVHSTPHLDVSVLKAPDRPIGHESLPITRNQSWGILSEISSKAKMLLGYREQTVSYNKRIVDDYLTLISRAPPVLIFKTLFLVSRSNQQLAKYLTDAKEELKGIERQELYFPYFSYKFEEDYKDTMNHYFQRHQLDLHDVYDVMTFLHENKLSIYKSVNSFAEHMIDLNAENSFARSFVVLTVLDGIMKNRLPMIMEPKLLKTFESTYAGDTASIYLSYLNQYSPEEVNDVISELLLNIPEADRPRLESVQKMLEQLLENVQDLHYTNPTREITTGDPIGDAIYVNYYNYLKSGSTDELEVLNRHSGNLDMHRVMRVIEKVFQETPKSEFTRYVYTSTSMLETAARAMKVFHNNPEYVRNVHDMFDVQRVTPFNRVDLISNQYIPTGVVGIVFGPKFAGPNTEITWDTEGPIPIPMERLSNRAIHFDHLTRRFTTKLVNDIPDYSDPNEHDSLFV